MRKHYSAIEAIFGTPPQEAVKLRLRNVIPDDALKLRLSGEADEESIMALLNAVTEIYGDSLGKFLQPDGYKKKVVEIMIGLNIKSFDVTGCFDGEEKIIVSFEAPDL